MNKKIIAIAIAGSMAVSLSAFANKGADYQPHSKKSSEMDWSKGWYIGAGVNGDSQASMDLHGMPRVLNHYLPLTFSGLSTSQRTELSENNLGFDAYVGRQVSKHWAVELGYTWLGNQTFTTHNDDIKVASIEVQQWNAHLVGIGILPVGHYVNMFFKGGAAYLSSEQEYKFTEVVGLPNVTDATRTMALTYGAGIELAMNHWGIRGEYNRLWPANNVEDDFFISDIISANVYYKFD